MLVLSAFCIGFLGATAFASYKITNNPKNETSFNLKADGDVSEGNGYIRLDTSKGYKKSGIEPPRMSQGGFLVPVTIPDEWGSSSTSDTILGYGPSREATLNVYLKIGQPYGNLVFTLKGEHTASETYFKYINHVSAKYEASGSSASVLDTDCTPKLIEGQNYSYYIDNRIADTASLPDTFHLCITYSISVPDGTNFKTLYNANSNLTVSFSAAFADTAVSSEAKA